MTSGSQSNGLRLIVKHLPIYFLFYYNFCSDSLGTSVYESWNLRTSWKCYLQTGYYIFDINSANLRSLKYSFSFSRIFCFDSTDFVQSGNFFGYIFTKLSGFLFGYITTLVYYSFSDQSEELCSPRPSKKLICCLLYYSFITCYYILTVFSTFYSTFYSISSCYSSFS